MDHSFWLYLGLFRFNHGRQSLKDYDFLFAKDDLEIWVLTKYRVSLYEF